MGKLGTVHGSARWVLLLGLTGCGQSHPDFGSAADQDVDKTSAALVTGREFTILPQTDGSTRQTIFQWEAASDAGDVNGDGFDDVIVSAYWFRGWYSSRAYVVFGKPGSAAVELDDIEAGIGGFPLNGESQAFLYAQLTVSAAGDVNGDGLDDLLVGDPVDYNYFRGKGYVVFGKEDSAAVELSDVSAGIGGFSITGEGTWDATGRYLANAGDVNGDGLDDVLLASPYATGDTPYSCRSYVVFGKKTTASVDLIEVAAGLGGYTIDCDDADTGALSASILDASGAGDVNGDGLDDVIVATASGTFGRSYVVFGKAGTASVSLSSVRAGSGGIAILGEAAGDYAGFSVGGGGDVNADGLSDIVIGAPGKSTTATFSGRAYVVFGTSSTANISLSDVAVGSGGFIVDGAAASDSAGVVVDVLRDVNADGLDDVAVACDRHLGDPAAAATHVVFGKTSTAPVSLATIPAGAEGLTRIEPRAPFDEEHGMGTSPAGDVDADGFDDFVLGPPLSENGYVVFGADFSGLVTLRGTKVADTLAATDPSAPDVLVGDLGWDTLSSDGGGDILLAG
ncbi:MAG TPA: integrin alpha, partial [Polyangiaceae bacterium]|nr:integrin alpha [Polyangiaceae bacterium]